MKAEPIHVLFVCSGSSARSLIAAAVANQRFGGMLAATAAVAGAPGEPHELTDAVLREQGLEPSGEPAPPWESFAGRRFDLVITLCDTARDEQCPAFDGDPALIHWHLPDPIADENPLDMMEAVHDALMEAIGMLVHAVDPSPHGRAVEAAHQLTRRFTPRAA